jgi:hypothetical protein
MYLHVHLVQAVQKFRKEVGNGKSFKILESGRRPGDYHIDVGGFLEGET